MNHALSMFDFVTGGSSLDDLSELRSAMQRLDAARHPTSVAKRLARPDREGWSWQRLHALWKEWVEHGRADVVLLDFRRHPELQKQKDIGLPQEFLDFAASKFLANQRKSKPAYRAILRQWEQWRKTGRAEFAIPGYDTAPPPGAHTHHPAGWSERNLFTQAQPEKAELMIAREGTVAAKPFLPFIPGTREGVRFLEYVFCDDVWHDRKIVLPGHVEPMRVIQLGCLDYASGVYLKFGLRPDVTREDGSRERLKRRDFLFLVAHLLLEYGWPTDYVMRFVVERATATMTLAEARFLYDISGGQVQVGYTSMEGQFVLAWDESKSGNPQGKGPLESWHNLFHNELGFAAGQVGRNRDHQAAALYGSDREAIALNKAALLLTPEQRRLRKLPYPTFAQAHGETLQIVQRINRRRDHALESFEKTVLWRLKGTQMDWEPESTYDPALEGRVDFLPVFETPLERMQRLSNGVRFEKPHPGAMVRFYEDFHTGTKIERRQAKVIAENKTFWFGPDSPLDALPEGTPVELHHAPQEPDYALVTSGGRFIGVWKRQLVRRNDADALAEGIKRKQTFLNHATSVVRGKMLDKLAEQDRRLNENAELLEEAGVLPSEADYTLAQRKQAMGTDVASAMQRATETLETQETEARQRAREAAKIALTPDAFLSQETDDENTPRVEPLDPSAFL